MADTKIEFKFDAGFEKNKVGKDLTLTYKDENGFMNSLEASGITKAEYKRVKNHEREYLSAVAKEASKVATKELQADNSIDRVFVENPFGDQKRSSATSEIKREQEYRVFGQNGQPDSTVKTSTFKMIVKDTATKLPKSECKELQQLQNSLLLK